MPPRPVTAISVAVSKAISFFLSAGFREHLRLGQGEGAASFHHAPTGNDALACGGSRRLFLNSVVSYPGVGRHQTKGSIACRAVRDGAHSSGMDEPVLLRYCRMGTQRDLDHAGRDLPRVTLTWSEPLLGEARPNALLLFLRGHFASPASR